MPDVHYPDHLIEANRDELRRMESLLHRLEDQNLHGKQRDQIRELEARIEAQGDLIRGLGEKLAGRDRLIARLRAGGRA